jgi:hypothetical protein
MMGLPWRFLFIYVTSLGAWGIDSLLLDYWVGVWSVPFGWPFWIAYLLSEFEMYSIPWTPIRNGDSV